MAADTIVDLPRGVDQVRVIAHAFGFVHQVIRIYPDAMPTDQAGTKRQEIPFGSCGFEHIERVDSQLVEDQRQFVHQRDIDVALDVLDHLCRFGHAHRRGAPGASGNDAGVQRIDRISCLGGRARGDLADIAQTPLAITGIDALGAIAAEEIVVEAQPGGCFEQGYADFFGGSRVDRGFVDHQIAGLECSCDQGSGAAQRLQIRLLEAVDRRRHSHDENAARGQIGRICGVAQLRCRSQLGIVQFQRGIVAIAQLRYTLRIDVEAQGVALLSECNRERQADIA